MAVRSAAGATVAPKRKATTPIRHRPVGQVASTTGFAHGSASTVTKTAKGSSGGGTFGSRTVQIRDIDAASGLNRAKGVGYRTVPAAQKKAATLKLVKAADVERARKVAARTPAKVIAHAKVVKATVKLPASKAPTAPATHATAGGGGTKSKPKPQTSPITPSDQGGVGGLGGSPDTGGGSSLWGSIEHYALIAAIVLLLIYAWRKGYIQKLGKSVARVGKGGKR